MDSVDPHDGYRWDAPNADFATLYCATRPLGSFVETLAYYRRNADFAAMLHSATDDEPDLEYDFDAAGGLVPRAYFELVLGQGRLDPKYRFIDHPRTHAQLTEELPGLLTRHGLRHFDRGVMMTQDRRVTRTVAGHLYSQAAATTAWYSLREPRTQRPGVLGALGARRRTPHSPGVCPADARAP
jgi:hypothetical protein